MKNFYEDDPTLVFVAIYSDGSGANIFYRDGGVFKSPCLDSPVDRDWFVDAGYLWFLPLPDDFLRSQNNFK